MARLAIDDQIQFYREKIEPYDTDDTRDKVLMQRVQAIESRETAQWIELAPPPR